MAAAGRAQFAVTSETSGKTVYIRLDAKRTAEPGSYGPKYRKCALEKASHVFVSEKGYGTPRLGTIYPKNDTFYSNTLSAAHVWALQQIVNLINGAPVSDKCSIEVESACGMCGHRLTDPVSIARGIGPECASKPTGTKILHASAFVQPQLPIDEVEASMKLTEAIADRIETARDEGASFAQAIEFAGPQFVGAEKLVNHIAEKLYGLVVTS
jgi:hypothetical protein